MDQLPRESCHENTVPAKTKRAIANEILIALTIEQKTSSIACVMT